jgi:hypothetical protein
MGRFNELFRDLRIFGCSHIPMDSRFVTQGEVPYT